MISIYTFKSLGKSEQVKLVSTSGCKIAERVVGGNRFYLYCLDGFFVEILHELASIYRQGITITRVFDDMDCLEPYVEKVDVAAYHA